MQAHLQALQNGHGSHLVAAGLSDTDFIKISKNVTWITCGSNKTPHFYGVEKQNHHDEDAWRELPDDPLPAAFDRTVVGTDDGFVLVAHELADLRLPAAVTVHQEADELVAQVVVPRVVEEPEPEEEEEGEAVEGEVPEGEEGEAPPAAEAGEREGEGRAESSDTSES